MTGSSCSVLNWAALHRPLLHLPMRAFATLETFANEIDWLTQLFFFHLRTYLPCLILKSSLKCFLTCLLFSEIASSSLSTECFWYFYLKREGYIWDPATIFKDNMVLDTWNTPSIAPIIYKSFLQNELVLVFRGFVVVPLWPFLDLSQSLPHPLNHHKPKSPAV